MHQWLKGMIKEEKDQAKNHFSVIDIVECKGYNKGWIRVDVYDHLVDNVWNN